MEGTPKPKLEMVHPSVQLLNQLSRNFLPSLPRKVSLLFHNSDTLNPLIYMYWPFIYDDYSLVMLDMTK